MSSVDLQLALQRLPLPDGDIVVLLDREKLEAGSDQHRNLYRTSSSGEVKWQVADYQPMPFLSTFTHIEITEEVIEAHNFDGGCYKISVQDGSVLGSYLAK